MFRYLRAGKSAPAGFVLRISARQLVAWCVRRGEELPEEDVLTKERRAAFG